MPKKTTKHLLPGKLAGLAIIGAMTAPVAALADDAPLQLPVSKRRSAFAAIMR